MDERQEEGAPPPQAPWRALHTRARSERKVAERPTHAGFESYAALTRQKRQWSDRVKRVQMPLFAGYVFARVEGEHLPRALGVPGMAEVVRSGSEAAVVQEGEMEAVRHLARGVDETGEAPEQVDPLHVGDQVVVTDGPFKGMTGTLVEVCGQALVAIRIEALKQATAVRMDRGAIAPMKGSG